MVLESQFLSFTESSADYAPSDCELRPCVSGPFVLTWASALALRLRDRAMNRHLYPKIHHPEIYILEGGYSTYFKESGYRCEPHGYIPRSDPHRVTSSGRERVGQFRNLNRTSRSPVRQRQFASANCGKSAINLQRLRSDGSSTGGYHISSSANRGKFGNRVQAKRIIRKGCNSPSRGYDAL